MVVAITSPLLGLPTELRLNIYSFMFPPLAGHPWHYQGLVLSCRQIRLEVEEEAVKSMSRYLKMVQDAWAKSFTSPLAIEMPKSFSRIKHVTVSISLPVVTKSDTPALIEPLSLLVPLYLSTLTFDVYAKDPSMNEDHAYYDYLSDQLWTFIMRKSVFHDGNIPHRLWGTSVTAADCVQVLLDHCDDQSRQELLGNLRDHSFPALSRYFPSVDWIDGHFGWTRTSIRDSGGIQIGQKWTTLSGRIHDARGAILSS